MVVVIVILGDDRDWVRGPLCFVCLLGRSASQSRFACLNVTSISPAS